MNVLTLKRYQDLLNEGHFAFLSPRYQIFPPGPQWVGESFVCQLAISLLAVEYVAQARSFRWTFQGCSHPGKSSHTLLDNNVNPAVDPVAQT